MTVNYLFNEHVTYNLCKVDICHVWYVKLNLTFNPKYKCIYIQGPSQNYKYKLKLLPQKNQKNQFIYHSSKYTYVLQFKNQHIIYSLALKKSCEVKNDNNP